MLNILAISGSLRHQSSNIAILEYLKQSAANHQFTIYDDMGSLPHFNPDLDTDTPPESVNNLRKQLKIADAVLICSPEYAFGVPGSLKNLLDWTVSSGDFVDKPVALITASSQGQYAHEALLRTLGAISAKIPEGGSLLIPFIRTKINNEGKFIDNETERACSNVLKALFSAAA